MSETEQVLKDKRVIVTAGGGGIGAAIAKMFNAAGAKVAICDLDKNSFKETHICYAEQADVGVFEQMEQFFKNATDHLGGLDILVNNAGIGGPNASLQNIDVNDWNKTININLNSTFISSKLAIPHLLKNSGGSIINIASTAALFGYPLRSPYAAAKWAIIGLTKTMAMELGSDQIRVNAICPGSVDGDRIDRVIQREADTRNVSFDHVKDGYLKQTSLKTFVEAEDIANMALYLASPIGAKISGQALAVDGHTESLTQF